MTAAFAAGCIREPEAKNCPSGIYCPAGAECAPREAVCIFDGCGNGVLQSGEICDDGDKTDGNGCSADCKSTEVCGNGIKDAAVGEVCDDGNRDDGDECSADCLSLEVCGNGNPDPGEECDAGMPTDYCNYLECSISRHGDGIVNLLDGEECDGGAPDAIDAGDDCRSADCNPDCTLSEHGDHVVNPLDDGEECDDGDPGLSTDDCRSATCDPDCTRTVCGDGYFNPLSEGCDDGNDVETDDCRSTCVPNVCGDGVVDLQGPVVEGCDLGPLNGRTGCDYGLTSCQGCSVACVPIPVMETDFCGDGTDDGAMEECDDARSFACGTCSMASCTIVDVVSATGRILVAPADLADGDFLTLADGLGGTATLEFDRDGACAIAGATCIAVSPTATALGIAADVERELDWLDAGSGLLIQAWTVDALVYLENSGAGMAGNVTIETGSRSGGVPTAIVVSGMISGAGCPLGDPCSASRDCVSNHCRDGVCTER
jgi:cysteine-rich repeat protein